MIATLKLFLKRYYLFLIIVVLVSYGQLLNMTPWQDDQSLYFKLQHLADKAGYFGVGPFGVGAYKYIITPFIPVYYFFGLNDFYYYLLALIAYILATLTVFKTYSIFINKNAGRISGFLFAAGFVSSDSFIRLFNSVVTSLSVIIVSILILSYWRFYKTRNYKWYLAAVLLFISAIEFVRTRTHYLIALPVIFEILFFIIPSINKKSLKQILLSFLRLTPFVYGFFNYFIKNADSRSGNLQAFFTPILRGDISVIYGYLSSITNLIIPDWFSNPILNKFDVNGVWISIFILISLFLLKTTKKKIAIAYILIMFAWYFISKNIFNNPVLNLNAKAYVSPFLGGVLIFLIFVRSFYLRNKIRMVYQFLFFWMLVNLLAYSAYNPTISYSTIHRYLTHSFIPLIGILGIEASMLFNKKELISKLALLTIVVWGLGNMVNAFIYQREILINRSGVIRSFYSQLRDYVPKLEKGDLLYFDVAENARGRFSDAFSVASMPEETALAWRYGVDRYDIRRFTDYGEFVKTIQSGVITDINKQEVKINNVYSFFYSADGLFNTTEFFKSGLTKNKKTDDLKFKTINTDEGFEIEFLNPIDSVTPKTLTLTLKADLLDISKLEYPIFTDKKLSQNPIFTNPQLRKLSFDYQRFKTNLHKNIKASSLNHWKEDLAANAIDDRADTYWRGDRVLWTKEGAVLTLDLGQLTSMDRFVWLNGYSNNTPTIYKIETSIDSKTWKEAIKVNNTKRLEPNNINVEKFEAITARYIRMVIEKTLSNDSASISEVWVVPSEYSKLDIASAEQFLAQPLGYVDNIVDYKETLQALNYHGEVTYSWLGDKSEYWQTNTNAGMSMNYNNKAGTYKIDIPSGGTKIDSIRLTNNQIKGQITINSIIVE